MWQALIGPIASLAKDWLGNKREKTQAKHRSEITRLEQAGDWEKTMAQGSLTSWKDEWFTVLLSLPILAVVYSVLSGDDDVIVRVNKAFTVLSTLPEWYQYLLGVAVLASFGIRGGKALFNMRQGK